jgi:hypothetical protein
MNARSWPQPAIRLSLSFWRGRKLAACHDRPEPTRSLRFQTEAISAKTADFNDFLLLLIIETSVGYHGSGHLS